MYVEDLNNLPLFVNLTQFCWPTTYLQNLVNGNIDGFHIFNLVINMILCDKKKHIIVI